MADDSIFDKRGRSAEAGFARDAERGFLAIVARDRKLGAWAADKIGLSGPDKEKYIAQLVQVNINSTRRDSIFEKILTDFDASQVQCSQRSLRRQMEDCLQEAYQELQED